mgnify:CR=1 FL=1
MSQRELCRDVVGRRVRLLKELTTRGSTIYPAGTVMTCDGTWRGMFDLRSDDRVRGHVWRGVMKVRRQAFEIVE